MKQININIIRKKAVYFSYELVYNTKVSLRLPNRAGSEVLDD